MKKIALINQNRCVACGACLKACPRGALSIHRGCFACADADKCAGCGLCARTCPANCIAIQERGTAHA